MAITSMPLGVHMSFFFVDERWLDLQPKNRCGLKILTLPVARMIARDFPMDWYVAPYATQWTVGKAGAAPLRFHVLDDNDEPLRFETIKAAQEYLRHELGVTNCVGPSEAMFAALAGPAASSDADCRTQ